MNLNGSVTREDVLKLMEHKSEIEKKLLQLKDILDRNGVGMNENLVDSDGYPRQDIDVYEVRHARHGIICLQNDHKEIMKMIEEGLHALHRQSSETVPTLPTSSYSDKKITDNSLPFAKVNHVEYGSPADIAGLQVDDFIISYGTITFDNFKSLQDVGELTRHSTGRKIPVIVKRFGVLEKLILVPNTWKGKGLLGCNIVPVEHVER